MTPDSFVTISREFSSELREQSSRFLAIAVPVAEEEEIDAALKRIRKKYFDATHHCYAYRLVGETIAEKFSDAGEPGGTAGKPILLAIQKYKLLNILVVVVRWFGGVKLGTGGLAKAYASSAEGTLVQCVTIERVMMSSVEIVYPHEMTNTIMHLVSRFGGKIISTGYDTDVHLTVYVRRGDVPSLGERLTESTRGRITCNVIAANIVV